jgi:hypothetical protein
MPSYAEVTQRAGSLRAMTGSTLQEFSALLPHFEQAFLASMQEHTIDGQPRTSRRERTDENSPLPMMADKLLFILTSLKQNPIQEVQGQLFGMSQSNANKWIHLLRPVLNRALAHQDLLPARNADELTALLSTKRTNERPPPPLLGMMVLSDPSTAHKILRSSRNTPVAKRSATRSKTFS